MFSCDAEVENVAVDAINEGITAQGSQSRGELREAAKPVSSVLLFYDRLSPGGHLVCLHDVYLVQSRAGGACWKEQEPYTNARGTHDLHTP